MLFGKKKILTVFDLYQMGQTATTIMRFSLIDLAEILTEPGLGALLGTTKKVLIRTLSYTFNRIRERKGS